MTHAPDPPHRPWQGVALALAGAAGFATKPILIKLAYGHADAVDAVTLLTLRMGLALPFFLGMALWSEWRHAGPPTERADWLRLVALGLLGYYLSSLLDFSGLALVPASLERLILFLYPTFVLLLGALLHGQRVRPAQWAALVVSYAGLWLVFAGGGRPDAGTARGTLLVLASAASFALFLVGSGRLIPRFGARRFTAWSMVVSCLAMGLHFALTRPLATLQVGAPVWGLAAALALFATVLPAFLMNAGIKRLGAGQVALIGNSGPVITLALAWGVLGERLTPRQMLGAGLVLVGVALVTRRRPAAAATSGQAPASKRRP